MKTSIPKLYLITDRHLSKQDEEKDVLDALESGIKIIQYREKDLPEHQIIATAKKLRILTRKYNALLIINDHPEIAEKIGADGIHIGQDDTPIEEARKTFKGKIIGVSAKTMEQSIAAEKGGATYIGLALLKAVKASTTIPIVAIGGIDKTNAKDVFNAGADSIAVISAIIGKDIKKESKELQEIIKE